MKRVFWILLLVLSVTSIMAGRSATPHPVYIELHDSEGKLLTADSLEVRCWLTRKPEQVMDLENSNLKFPVRDFLLQIQCSGFDSWSAGDTLHVEIYERAVDEYLDLDLELTFDNFQLFSDYHLLKAEKKEE